MVACHAAICAALERELGDRHGLGVSDFEVLDRLAECPDAQCRSQDLAESVHLSQSALSRLVDRLVKNALVERCACDDDRRGIYVVLTAGGPAPPRPRPPSPTGTYSRGCSPRANRARVLTRTAA